MNDITALARREKFEAWLEEAEALPWGYLKKRRTSDDAYHEPNTTDMWGAWQAASAELVEALEKAQTELERYRTAFHEWSDKTEWVQKDKRFDVLKPWGKHRADVLKEYIGHLESRTVTVKLRKRSVGEVMHMSGFSRDYAEGWCSGNDNAIHEMRAAGIQVIEGEGQ